MSLSRLFSRRRPCPAPAAPRSDRFRPRLLALEDRLTPTIDFVTSNLDNGMAGTLRVVVASAAAGDTIEFSLPAGSTITLTGGEISLSKNLTIDGQTNNITISGNSASRIFEVSTGVTATVNHLTLTRGQETGVNGGAVLVDAGATLTLNSDTFIQNQVLNGATTFAYGGAIENDGNLTVNSSNFGSATTSAMGNASQEGGGAIDSFSTGGTGTLVINNSGFYGNLAGGTYGGAIDTNDSTTLSGDTFGGTAYSTEGNIALAGGGAVDAFGATPGTTTLTVKNSTFTDNKVTGTSGYGGAISTTDILSVTSPSGGMLTTFSGNSAPFGGGAIDYFISNTSGAAFNSSMTLTDVFFTGNSGESGGAVYSDVKIASGSVSVNITADTFASNNATGSASFVYGGGLDAFHSTSGTGSASATLVNDTFFQNTSINHGGGLAVTNDNTGTGTNTIALTSLTVNANTAATDGGGVYLSGGTVSVNNNIFNGNTVTASGYTGPKDVTVAAGGILNDIGFNWVDVSDTQFSTANHDILGAVSGLATALAQNGAPANVPETLALATTSPAYHTGNQSLATMAAPFDLDERGFIRQTGLVSIGAEDPSAII